MDGAVEVMSDVSSDPPLRAVGAPRVAAGERPCGVWIATGGADLDHCGDWSCGDEDPSWTGSLERYLERVLQIPVGRPVSGVREDARESTREVSP